jgi:hypothetical protein
VDFRYAPPEWQTAICLPDDPHKTLVDRSGELLYHYNQGDREFATRVRVETVPGAVWQRQELHSPRIPIVRTFRTADGLDIREEAFAATNPAGPTRNDLILVHVTNPDSAPRGFIRDWWWTPRCHSAFRQKRTGSVSTSERRSPPRYAWPSSSRNGSYSAWSARVHERAGRRGATFFVLYAPAINRRRAQDREAGGGLPEPCGEVLGEGAVALRPRAVPDAGIQALVDSSIRNIWQARSRRACLLFRSGLLAIADSGLWMARSCSRRRPAWCGPEARNGVAYELTHQQPDGRIEVMKNYSKENGIVLWTCVRHAQLTQDKAWLESVWPRLERVANHIRTLRGQTLTNNSTLDDGLMPAGFPDGGIGGVIDEYTNPYWNLLGVRAFIEAAHWLERPEEVASRQPDYDDFMAAFRRAAQRDVKTDPHGHAYVPIRMDGQDLPQRGQWAFCHAVYPGQVFAPDDPLVASTMAAASHRTRGHGLWYRLGRGSGTVLRRSTARLAVASNGARPQALAAFANHAAPTLRGANSLLGEPFKRSATCRTRRAPSSSGSPSISSRWTAAMNCICRGRLSGCPAWSPS